MQHYPAHTSFKADLNQENLPTEEILGFDLVNATAARTVRTLMDSGKSKVAFLNAHCVNTARRDPQYAAALQRADFILPDGAGIELAAKLAGKRLVANLNGTDFVPILMKEAARQGKRVFLLGGKPGTAAAAAARISLMIPGLQVVGTCDGYGQREQAIHMINASGADILARCDGRATPRCMDRREFRSANREARIGCWCSFGFLGGQRAARA